MIRYRNRVSRIQPRVNVGQIVKEVVDIQTIGARLVIYGDINDPVMNYFNPGIAWDGKVIKIAIRSCNFTTLRHGKWEFLDGNIYSKTDVIYGDVDPDTLDITNLHKLNLGKGTPTKTQIAGLEDVRLYMRKDGMHAIGFEVDRVTPVMYQKSGLAEYLIKGDELIYLRSLEKPEENRVEKNWQPTDVYTNHFDFTYSPTQTWQKGRVYGKEYKGEVHGGSQLLKQNRGYLSLVHEKIQDKRYGQVYDKFVYQTMLAKHDDNGIITELSEPFRFGTLENIEFASGMVEHKGDLIISLGIRDCKFALARISKERLMSLFKEGSK